MVNTKGKKSNIFLKFGGLGLSFGIDSVSVYHKYFVITTVTPVLEVMVHLKKVMLLILHLKSSKTSYGGDSLQLLRKDLAAFNGFLPCYI